MSGGPGFETAEKVAHTVARHDMFRGGETVVVAVSGGPDSMCLLDVLARLGADLDLVVAHVDHGLSETSEEVATEVAGFAAQRGFDVHVARARDLAGPNLHARARDFRYAFFETIANDVGATRIATGHTLDDRVETLMARLIHGAGTEGLAGIQPAEGMRVRPSIDLRRDETRAYCEEAGLSFHDDPSNSDLRFDRSKIRSELMADISRWWGEGAVLAMATSAARLGEDAKALRGMADRLYGDLATVETDGIRFDIQTVLAMPRALQRRLLERAIGRIRDRSYGIDAALDALVRTDRKVDARFAVAEGNEIVLHRDHIKVYLPGAPGPVEEGQG